MSALPTKIVTDLQPDTPLQQSASTQFNATDRQYIDTQILGCQQHLALLLLNGIHGTYLRVAQTSAALVAGDVVCLAGSSSGYPTITLATATPLGVAGSALGVVLLAASPGSLAVVAIGGVLGPDITGLAATSGLARVSSAGRCERVASLSTGDYPLGTVDAQGYLTILKAVSAGSGGDMSAADKRFLDSLHGGHGADLTNADSTIQISDGALRVLPAGTLTGHHTVTLSLTGSVVDDQFEIVREDVSTYLYSVLDGGSLGTSFTFPAYQTGSVVFERATLGWFPRDRGLGPVVAGPDSPARFRVEVGTDFVPRSNETVLLDSADGNVVLPQVPSALSGQSIVVTVIGQGTGGTVAAFAGDSLPAGTDTVSGSQVRQYHAVCGAAKWAVLTGAV